MILENNDTKFIFYDDNTLNVGNRIQIDGEIVNLDLTSEFNKAFAKLGSDYKKPDAITRIEEDNYREIVYPLPVEDLLYWAYPLVKTSASLLTGR